MSAQQTKLAAALALAEQGRLVIPLHPNGKRPIFDNWPRVASSNPQQIKAWWAEHPDANIGHVLTEDDIVVDCDPRNGGNTTQTVLELEGYTFPPTREHRTPSGGTHKLYRRPAGAQPITKDSRGKVLGPGLDLLTKGAQIVAPGSVINGVPYAVSNAAPSVDAANWIIERAAAARPKSGAAGKRLFERTEEGDEIARKLAKAWLREYSPHADHGAIDNTAIEVAYQLGDFDVPPEDFVELLSQWSHNRAHPPMEMHDVERVAASGIKSRKRAWGTRHPFNNSGFEAIKIDESLKPENIPLWCQDGRGPMWADSGKSPAAPVPTGKLIKSTAAFLADFVPPSYLVDGIISRQYIYSCTALTGAGKTAIALLLAYCVAEGQRFGDREVETARVVYFAGENSTDVKMRWIAMAENLSFDPDKIEVHFIDGVVPLSKVADRIREEIDTLGGAELLIVDTCAAYFEGDNENDNVQMLVLAKRLREFTTLACRPGVLVLCHPVKNATNDNLLPRGGGSFLNEMDGNLTIAANDKVSMLHWQGKIRGPDFEPMAFQMVTGMTAKRLIDHKGRQLHTVVARALNAATQAALEDNARRDEDRVLIVMRDHPGLSIAGMCERLGWHNTANGDPLKSKMHRVLKRLGKLVRKERSVYVLTEAGMKAAVKLT
jgi:hypothetical protein